MNSSRLNCRRHFKRGGFDVDLGRHLGKGGLLWSSFYSFLKSRIQADGSLAFPEENGVPEDERRWAEFVKEKRGRRRVFVRLEESLKVALKKGGFEPDANTPIVQERSLAEFQTYLRSQIDNEGKVRFPHHFFEWEAANWAAWVSKNGKQAGVFERLDPDLKAALTLGGYRVNGGARRGRFEDRWKEFEIYLESLVASDGSLRIPPRRTDAEWGTFLHSLGGIYLAYQKLNPRLQRALRLGGYDYEAEWLAREPQRLAFESYLRGRIQRDGSLTFPPRTNGRERYWDSWIKRNGGRERVYTILSEDLQSALRLGGYDPEVGSLRGATAKKRRDFIAYMENRRQGSERVTLPSSASDDPVEAKWGRWVGSNGGQAKVFEFLPLELQAALLATGFDPTIVASSRPYFVLLNELHALLRSQITLDGKVCFPSAGDPRDSLHGERIWWSEFIGRMGGQLAIFSVLDDDVQQALLAGGFHPEKGRRTRSFLRSLGQFQNYLRGLIVDGKVSFPRTRVGGSEEYWADWTGRNGGRDAVFFWLEDDIRQALTNSGYRPPQASCHIVLGAPALNSWEQEEAPHPPLGLHSG